MAKETSVKYVDTKVTCACGNTFTVKSNHDTLHIEVCNKCHPAFTGEQGKTKSKAGAIDKFNRKYGLNKEEI